MEMNIVCIRCPVGCALRVLVEDNVVTKVEGQGCQRGERYAREECVNPTRIFTSSVPVTGGTQAMLSVKSARDIPKQKVMGCAQALRGIVAEAPVYIGDVVARDIAGTGVDIVATRNVPAI